MQNDRPELDYFLRHPACILHRVFSKNTVYSTSYIWNSLWMFRYNIPNTDTECPQKYTFSNVSIVKIECLSNYIEHMKA